MRYLSLHEIKLKSSCFSGHTSPRQNKIEELKREALETNNRQAIDCQEAKRQIEISSTDVSRLQVSVNEHNDMIENMIIPKLFAILFHNKRKLEELKKTNLKLNDQMQEINSKNSQLEELKVKLEMCPAKTFQEISSLLDEAEDAYVPIAEWIRRFKISICDDENAITRTLEDFERTKQTLNTIEESLKYRESVSKETLQLPCLKPVRFPTPKLPQKISTEMLKEMSPHIKELIVQGNMFAIQELDGQKRLAKISITPDTKFALHRLKDDPLPPNAHLVEFNDILKMVQSAPQLTFLELSNTSGSSLGIVYIRLIPGLKRSQQFSALCTGEMGPTYAESKSLGVIHKGSVMERLQFGDYERNDGLGGKAIIPSVGNAIGGNYIKPWLEGTVTGRWPTDIKATQFYIYTRGRPAKNLDGTFGVVENGLRVLSDAIFCNPNIKDVVISDCGLIFSVG